MNNTTTKASVSTRYLVSTALMTAVLCILAPMSIPIPVSPVPISLTNLVLYFGLFLLPWKQMFLSYVVYMLLGICGLPVFSGFSGGLGKLIGPTGGYLAGFLFLIVIAGIFMPPSNHLLPTINPAYYSTILPVLKGAKSSGLFVIRRICLISLFDYMNPAFWCFDASHLDSGQCIVKLL